MIVMGYLKFAYLGNLLTSWVGEDGGVRKISASTALPGGTPRRSKLPPESLSS